MLSNEERGYLDTMSPEDKYRLYTECEFLINGNYAKLNYISETGFGKMLLRFVTGRGRKTEKKILKNTIELQEKMKDLLVCLDDEILDHELRLRYQSHILIELHFILLDLANHVNTNAEHIE